jgi:hypothetical protein
MPMPCGAHSPLIRTSTQGLDRGSRSRRPRVVGQPTHLHREIAKAEAILDRPSSSSRAAQHKAAVAMAYNLLSWHGYRATTTRGRKWAQLAGILTGDQKVDLFDHLRAFKRRPVPTVEKLRGARAILYWTRR